MESDTPPWKAYGSYAAEFIEHQKLGGGGQGAVFKAFHKLDKREYAVKKVKIDPSSNTTKILLREVRTLSSLSHSNIVRYHSSWIEGNQQEGHQQESDDEFASTSSVAGDEFASTSSVVFDSSRQTADQEKQEIARDFEDLSGSENVSGKKRPKESEADTTEQGESSSQATLSEPEGSSAILYIQMELCTSTLREWIDKRNATRAPSVPHQVTIKEMMCQILKGVKFIHEEGLIHRDLKPENIFLQGDHVKIGDFGLAKWGSGGENETPNISGSSDTKAYCAGTKPYAAPERVLLQDYDEKSDIFSLGVMFVEMCYRILTTTEKMEIARELQNGHLPKALKDKAWKRETRAIRRMCRKDATRRPTADDLLSGALFLTPEQEIIRLEKIIWQKDARIKQLRQGLRKYSPHLLLAKLRSYKAQLDIDRAQLKRLKEKSVGKMLSPSEASDLLQSVNLSGINFQSTKSRDFFEQICQGMLVVVHGFYEDVLNLLAAKSISSGIDTQGLQEFDSQHELLEKSVDVVLRAMRLDASMGSKLFSRLRSVDLTERITMLKESTAGAQGGQSYAGTSGREKRKRKKSGKGTGRQTFGASSQLGE
ncbi:eukaryotic translation initiation factor 2-alpha kinase 1-like isoform X2 [Littorina saxatilis]|uniref:non-specific serine/threonine protein kinase n=1 Tax=Littorina saxatilis TaxID=31220 RepID=A0AAN9C106_9CAEN